MRIALTRMLISQTFELTIRFNIDFHMAAVAMMTGQAGTINFKTEFLSGVRAGRREKR